MAAWCGSAGARELRRRSVFLFAYFRIMLRTWVLKARTSRGVRADLAEVIERHEVGRDAARPEAVARRRKTGQRTARENMLCDAFDIPILFLCDTPGIMVGPEVENGPSNSHRVWGLC